MKIGILGSGMVGKALATALGHNGHDVKLGTRNPDKDELKEYKASSGIDCLKFDEAARHGDIVFICTKWSGTENALQLAGASNMAGKVVVDVTNPLDDSQGMPPVLAVGFSDSAGEQVQKWLSKARVVKAFNIITASIMVDGQVDGEPLDMFIAGDDEAAKKDVEQILTEFKWNTHDLGGIEKSRLLEPFAMLWITYGFKTNSWNHAFKLVKKE